MSLPLRKTFFWIHLVVGVVAGIVIAVMSVTGVAIAFEPQVLAWAESEARTVTPPAGDVKRLGVEELMARVRAAKPDAQVSGVTLYPEPTAAAQVNLGRSGSVFVDPYTGELREGGAEGWRHFFHTMEEWHRWLATEGGLRALGKGFTGASNAGFLFLALSGLYLWFPRKWSLKQLRPIVWFRGGLKGKARDFNWHNVIGFWSLPVLVVLTASGMVISYKWASDFVFTLTGNTPPSNQGPPGSASVKVEAPAPGTQRLALEPLFAAAQQAVPAWESITYRIPAPPRGAGPRPEGGGEGKGPGGQRGEGARGGRNGADGQAPSEASSPRSAEQRQADAAPAGDAVASARGATSEGGPSQRGGADAAPAGDAVASARGATSMGGPSQRGGADAAPAGDAVASASGATSEGGPSQRGGADAAPSSDAVASARGATSEGGPAQRGGADESGSGRPERRRGEPDGAPGEGGRDAGKVDAVTLNIRERDSWPYFATTQLSLNPFSGEVAKREGYADFNSGRKLRTWLRFLHTGEALGWPGQLIAAIASLGGVFLVWTGFALAWRRFFPRRQARVASTSPASAPQEGSEPVA